MNQQDPLTPDEACLAIALHAAFADGEKSEAEREKTRLIAADLGSERLSDLTRQILTGRLPLEAAVADLPEGHPRLLAYELALGVCEAGGSVSDAERAFLDRLRAALEPADARVPAIAAETLDRALPAVARESAPAPLPGPDNGPMILRYAILNGALELLPETMATMAIIPLQMKMVYRIGASHGATMDAGRIKEFLAAAGLGVGSQVVEGFARKFLGRFAKSAVGKMAGRAADQLAGSAFSFASTYAIGHLAERYHSGGRHLDAASLRSLFESLAAEGRRLQTTYQPQIAERARGLTPANIVSLIRGSEAV